MENKNKEKTENIDFINKNLLPSHQITKPDYGRKKILIVAIVVMSLFGVVMQLSVFFYVNNNLKSVIVERNQTAKVSTQLSGLHDVILKLSEGYYKVVSKGVNNKLIPLGTAPNANKVIIQEAKDVMLKEEGAVLKNVSGGKRETLPDGLVQTPTQQELADSGVKLADYITERIPQTNDDKVNYLIAGSEGTTLLSRAETYKEIVMDTKGNILETIEREIPNVTREALASFPRQISDMDIVPLSNNFRASGLPDARIANTVDGLMGERFPFIPYGEIPKDARTILNDSLGLSGMAIDNRAGSIYGNIKAAEVTVDGKSYIIPTLDDMFSYGTLKRIVQCDEKIEQSNIDFKILQKAAEGMYSEGNLLDNTSRIIDGFQSKWGESGKQIINDGIGKIFSEGGASNDLQAFFKNPSLFGEKITPEGMTISKLDDLAKTKLTIEEKAAVASVAGLEKGDGFVASETNPDGVETNKIVDPTSQILTETPAPESVSAYSWDTGMNFANNVLGFGTMELPIGLAGMGWLAGVGTAVAAPFVAPEAITAAFVAGGVLMAADGVKKMVGDPSILKQLPGFVSQDLKDAYEAVTNPQAANKGDQPEALVPSGQEKITTDDSAKFGSGDRGEGQIEKNGGARAVDPSAGDRAATTGPDNDFWSDYYKITPEEYKRAYGTNSAGSGPDLPPKPPSVPPVQSSQYSPQDTPQGQLQDYSKSISGNGSGDVPFEPKTDTQEGKDLIDKIFDVDPDTGEVKLKEGFEKELERQGIYKLPSNEKIYEIKKEKGKISEEKMNEFNKKDSKETTVPGGTTLDKNNERYTAEDKPNKQDPGDASRKINPEEARVVID